MRVQVALTILIVLLAAAPPAHADPGLSSLAGLLPLYIIALSVFLLCFYALPAWLTFRAKKIHAERGLSNTRLLLLLVPAATVGGLGLADFIAPIGLVSGIAYGVTGSFALYWIFLAMSVLLVYLAGSTYRACKALPGGQ